MPSDRPADPDGPRDAGSPAATGAAGTAGGPGAADVVVVVSACLLGSACTYRGSDERHDGLLAALADRTVVPVCPEVAGGLPVPRPRCEAEGGDGDAVLDGRAGVVDAHGTDHAGAYRRGAAAALETVRRTGARLAVLKDRSPSCGAAGIYDGTHTRTLRADGVGVTVALLRRHGVEVVTEHEALARLSPGAGPDTDDAGAGAG